MKMRECKLFVMGVLLASVLASYAAKREDVDLSQWSVNGTRVTATAAQLNQLATGDFTVNDATIRTNATVGGDVIAGDDINVGDDLVVSGKVTVGETAEITGVATFTSESVHNAGIDADYITVDANLGINSKSAGPLQIGTNTTTSINYGSAVVTAHTFVTDGTGTGEIVLPNESIGNAELASGIDASKLTGNVDGARLTNAVGVGAAMITITNYGVGDLYGTNVITFFGTVSYP